MNKAVFLDRDGIIIKMVLQASGTYDSPQTVEQVSLVEDISKIITWLNKKNIPVVEISNQPGVALGKTNWQTLEEIEEKAHTLLDKQDVHLDRIYRCFHHPKSQDEKLKIICDCRKPKPGMLLQAAKELNLDLNKCVFLGDNATDVEAGKAVGCITLLYFHENDLEEKIKAKKVSRPDFIVYSLQEVIPILMEVFK